MSPGFLPGQFRVFRQRSSVLAVMVLLGLLIIGISGCAPQHSRVLLTTGYCGCGQCCGWERGSWRYLKLDFWNRYVASGPGKGTPYTGMTASGRKPRSPQPGLFSGDSVSHPWMIPIRIIFPWLWLHHDGTIAADTRYYPFGTRMYVPGYGWGMVSDRGSAIKGPDHIDLYFVSHDEALHWGRRRLRVIIER